MKYGKSVIISSFGLGVLIDKMSFCVWTNVENYIIHFKIRNILIQIVDVGVIFLGQNGVVAVGGND